jgi:uncharacterized protein (DUF924 family)
MNTAEHILNFWFGDEFVDGFPLHSREALWFQSNRAIDQEIKAGFATDVERAAKGQLDHWQATPQGRLALIVLLDQFPRNIYRGTPHAFAYDSLASGFCKEGIELGHDAQLRPVERIFYYLPLEHSESLAMQELSVSLMQVMLDNAIPSQHTKIQGFLNYALSHHDIIARFGRFPHRNSILGRDSTVAEIEFMKSGPTFGQQSLPGNHQS